MQEKLNFSLNKVLVARREILKAYMVLIYGDYEIIAHAKPYVYYNGCYYILDSEYGDYVVLRIKGIKTKIHKSKCVIDR